MKDKRKSQRRRINRHAKIQVAGSMLSRDCLVTDISEGGARLHMEYLDIPDTFGLLLSEGDGKPQLRSCEVAWRLGFELGAKFTDAPRRDHAKANPARRPVTA